MIENDNNIAELQNEISNLEKLSAQNYLYSSAKKFKVIQIVLSVVLVIIISFFKIIFEKNNSEIFLGLNWKILSPYLSLISVMIIIINSYVIKPIITRKIKFASLIQYDFDSAIMGIKKNSIYQDNCPSYESIRKYSLKNSKKGYTPDYFRNWYSSNINSVNKIAGNFICIKTNLVWDMNLRIIYRNIILICIISISLLLLIPSFILGVTIKSFILEVIIPLMPLYTFGISEIKDNSKTIFDKNKIQTIIQLAWTRILEKTISDDELYQLSKECLEYLLHLRKENPLIFDWFYKITKSSSNDEMEYSAEKLIEDYKNSI